MSKIPPRWLVRAMLKFGIKPPPPPQRNFPENFSLMSSEEKYQFFLKDWMSTENKPFASEKAAQPPFFQSVPDLNFKNGRVQVDEHTYQTSNPKVFAGGDCINGGMETVNAAYDGKQAALGIDKYLNT